MSVSFVFSQIFVIFAMISIGITYFIKSKSTILFLSILSSIFYCLEYGLLSAWTGLASCIIAIIRSIWLYWTEQKNIKNPLATLIIIDCVFIIFGVVTWQGPISILPIASNIIFNYMLWDSHIAVYKWLAPLTNACFVAYNYFINSPFGAISDSIMIVVEIIGIILYYRSKQTSGVKSQVTLSDNQIDASEDNTDNNDIKK